MKHPIDHIVWLPAESLKSNTYNPNFVMNPELVLLERSLLRTGWIQPILVQEDERWIVDGFHRWNLAMSSEALKRRDGGLVPCALMQLPMHEAMMLTVRINRAKGTHGALAMHELVSRLVNEHGCDPEEVARGIGATREEVDVLLQENVFKARDIANYRYSKAWVPGESGKGNRGGAAFLAGKGKK